MKRSGREQVLPIRGPNGYAALATDGDGTLLLKKHMARATVAHAAISAGSRSFATGQSPALRR